MPETVVPVKPEPELETERNVESIKQNSKGGAKPIYISSIRHVYIRR